MLLYIDADSDHRRFADAVLRSEYQVVAGASLDDVDERIAAAVIVIDLSHALNPVPIMDRVRAAWPAAPVVVVLAPDAPLEHDHTALWELGPASIVVNPLAPGALRDGVATALS